MIFSSIWTTLSRPAVVNKYLSKNFFMTVVYRIVANMVSGMSEAATLDRYFPHLMTHNGIIEP